MEIDVNAVEARIRKAIEEMTANGMTLRPWGFNFEYVASEDYIFLSDPVPAGYEFPSGYWRFTDKFACPIAMLTVAEQPTLAPLEQDTFSYGCRSIGSFALDMFLSTGTMAAKMGMTILFMRGFFVGFDSNPDVLQGTLTPEDYVLGHDLGKKLRLELYESV